MKQILSLIFLFSGLITTAQQYDFIPKEYHLMSSEEKKILLKKKLFIVRSLSEDGTVIKETEVKKFMTNPDYDQLLFMDNNEKLIIVYKKLSKEEKKERLKKPQEVVDFNKKELDESVGKTAPDFDVVDIKGNNIKLSQLKGKTVVLNFWFTKCEPCIIEMPELEKIKNEFEKDGIVFLALTFDDKITVETFLEKHPWSYNIIPNASETNKLYKINNYPTNIIINKEGIISFFQMGYGTSTVKKIKTKLKELLDK